MSFSSPSRLRALVRKEALQIVRDPSSIAIAFLLPMVLLFIFGYGVSLDARNIPVAVVVEEPSALTASFTAAFAQSPYFDPKTFRVVQEAEQALMERKVRGMVWIRANFAEKELSMGNAPIGVFVDGVDANNARGTYKGCGPTGWSSLRQRGERPWTSQRPWNRGSGSTRR